MNIYSDKTEPLSLFSDVLKTDLLSLLFCNVIYSFYDDVLSNTLSMQYPMFMHQALITL